LQKLAVRLKYKIRKMAGSPDKWYGLENSNLVIEYVPLFIRSKHFNPFVKTK
jgi:KUP system potassium uptake protein